MDNTQNNNTTLAPMNTLSDAELLNTLSVEEKKKIIAKYGTTELTFKQASEVLKEYK